jgi:hypothetical protein
MSKSILLLSFFFPSLSRLVLFLLQRTPSILCEDDSHLQQLLQQKEHFFKLSARLNKLKRNKNVKKIFTVFFGSKESKQE